MIKIKTVSFPKLEYRPSPVFQVYELTSNAFRTEDYIQSIRIEVYNFLALKFKEPVFQIMVIADESLKDFKAIKTIVKITDQEYEYFKQSEYNFFYKGNLVIESGLGKLLDYYSDDVAVTKEKEEAQLWCNTIKKYLANTINFCGDIRLKIAFNEKQMEYADFTATGKGTSDNIISKLKNLSSIINYNNETFYKTEDEIYNLIDDLKVNFNGERNNG